MDDLDRLIEAVEAGNLHEQPYCGMPMATACYPRDPSGKFVEGSGWSDAAVLSAYHGSLDAAKALHDALLPGWIWSVSGKYAAVMDHDGSDDLRDLKHFLAKTDNPARAWLLAILKAYRQVRNG